jgi:hypothetical protein
MPDEVRKGPIEEIQLSKVSFRKKSGKNKNSWKKQVFTVRMHAYICTVFPILFGYRVTHPICYPNIRKIR